MDRWMHEGIRNMDLIVRQKSACLLGQYCRYYLGSRQLQDVASYVRIWSAGPQLGRAYRTVMSHVAFIHLPILAQTVFQTLQDTKMGTAKFLEGLCSWVEGETFKQGKAKLYSERYFLHHGL